MTSDYDKLDEIDQYLSGLLEPAAEDEFEARLLIDPALQSAVTEQIALRQAMKAEANLLVPKEHHSNQPEPSLLRKFSDWLTSPTWAYSATAMLAALTIAILLPGQTTTVSPEASIDARLAVVRNLDLSRGSEKQVTIPPVRAGETIVLSIDAYGLALSTADFSLSRDGERLVDLIGIKPGSDELYTVTIDPLPAGQYQIVMASSGQRPVQFSLTVDE